ncbi:hypothetical protein NC652_038532 [Populus alba x Populus x berolinensis]|uniref:RING-type E3 ubiquitin transferase n=1 Tax=Populus tomentosa TaxID=118781 RepID=A0A8X7XYM6_POPTO|nr:hypothetical protein POTOM_054131 [Populus tomentosa]KAJ6867339.1 hypothetical protein NC652_038532 [Populus alba x Populus x berolinensis]
MVKFPEENEDGPSNPSRKRQRVSSTSGGFSAATPNQETQQHVENENQEATQQHQENENRETTHQHEANENQETQQHVSNEEYELTEQPEASENEETQQHQENENQESSDEEDEYLSDGGAEAEREDDVLDKLSSFLGGGAMSMTLMDLDILDCAICSYPLTIPVFQCENGHTACFSCCSKLAHKCPTCSLPIGNNRCRAIEKVLESVRIPCENMRYGCGETFIYSEKYNHDKSCIYAPCSCPIQGCNFISSSKKLDPHLRCRHVGDVIRFYYGGAFPLPLSVGQNSEVLQETDDGAIFILHHHEETFGNIVTISCLGPPTSAGEYFYELSTNEYFYDLSNKSQGKSFKFQSYMQSIQSRVDHPLSAGLVLPPGQFFGTSKMIYLDLIIWRKGDCPLNIQSSTNAN